MAKDRSGNLAEKVTSLHGFSERRRSPPWPGTGLSGHCICSARDFVANGIPRLFHFSAAVGTEISKCHFRSRCCEMMVVITRSGRACYLMR